MRNHLTVSILAPFWSFLAVISLGAAASASVFSDPCVPDGEQFVWRWFSPDTGEIISTVTWHTKDRNGRPVYEIIADSGAIKQGKYVIDKSDLRLVWLNVVEETRKGMSDITIEARDNRQYLVHDYKNERKNKEIDEHPDGYNGLTLSLSLRGYPFGQKKEVNIKLTPPFQPGIPRWAWRMWDSYAKLMGEETISVPAGTFDCYKLEIAASGGLIKRVTSKYYFWFERETPHRFVKYQDEDGETVTELLEIKCKGVE